MITETDTAAEAAPTPREEQFFGITTSIEEMLPKKEEVKEEVIVIATEEDDNSTPEVKEDISKYSNKVQKRIDKLTWQAKEAERQRDTANDERNEAYRTAKRLYGQSQQQAQIISTGEARLVKEMTDKAALLVTTAKSKYAKAYEEGNTEAILSAQEDMIKAQASNQTAQSVDAEYQGRVKAWAQQQQYMQQQPQRQYVQPKQQQPQARVPTPESTNWTKENPWFGQDEHRDMTAIAYATHETMIRDEGIKPDTPEYYEKLDSTIRGFFPNYFPNDAGTEHSASTGKPHAVVAPATRSTGSNPRKVKLNASQRSLAKAIGITDEQYAFQLLKENNRA
jgi:hypothetical protein